MPVTLQPAPEIALHHGHHTLMLRASLRAAVALENLPGGIPAIWDALARQKVTPIYAVIRATAVDREQAEALITDAATKPLCPLILRAQAACLALLVSLLTSAQGEASPSSHRSSPELKLGEFFAEPFSLATSWLRWPPSEVWNASLSEIITALEAQADRELRRAGIEHPDRTKDAATRRANTDAGFDPEFDRAGLMALKARHGA